MKRFLLLCALLPSLAVAAGLDLKNGRFGEKEYGKSTHIKLTEKQLTSFRKAKSPSYISQRIELTETQRKGVFQTAGLKINHINVFESQAGYADCTCLGVPANLGSLQPNGQVQLPLCFLEDSYMEKASEQRLQKMLQSPSLLGTAQPTCTSYLIQGDIGGAPVSIELTLPKDSKQIIEGHYRYLAGKFKGSKFKLLGEYSEGKTKGAIIKLREYTHTPSTNHLRHSADLTLTRTDKLIAKDSWLGSLTNIDGSQFRINLKTVKKISTPDAQARNH